MSGSEPPPQLQNLAKLVQEVKEVTVKLPPQEMRSLMQESQAATALAADPATFVEAVSELNAEELKELQGVLDESGVVPPEQRQLVEEALKPGGYADTMATVAVWASWFMENKHVALAPPGAEFLLTILLSFSDECGVPLISWLRTDAFLGFGACAAAYFASEKFAPVLREVKADPMGTASRFQAVQSNDIREKCTAAVPGVPFNSYHPLGTLSLAALVLLLALGEVWAVFGVLELLAAPLLGCSGAIWLVSLLFIAVRAGALLGALYVAYWVLTKSGMPMPAGLPGAPPRAPGQSRQDLESRGVYQNLDEGRGMYQRPATDY